MTRLCRALASLVLVVLVCALLPLAPLGSRAAGAQAIATSMVINEFLAVNDTTAQDNTGQYEDWIELRNTTGSTTDLGGWTISDGGESYTFAGGTLVGAGAYRLFWASGETTRSNGTDIHLPFKLSGSGESLTLTDPNGTPSEPGWAAPAIYPPQLADDSYGVAPDGELRYFTDPTPGGPNNAGQAGVAQPVLFSVDHGFYNSPQTLVLSTATSAATIRYTTNGEAPSPSVGTAIASGTAITIAATTTVRAVAYRDGWITSPVETRSYLFTGDIIRQGSSPLGWPTDPVNGQVFDHGMDPNVVNGNETTVENALVSIPTISVVTDPAHLFDPSSGIWVNAGRRGREWERPASVELIDPQGQESGFDIEAGLRIRGGFSRSTANPKHALRLFFRDDYESQLDYPLFGAEGTDRFEKVDLRTSQNYGWQWRRSDEATWLDEVWSRDTQGEMGQPYTRSRQYHLYLNGVYNGIYMTQERVSGEFGESYFGGNEDDFDVVKRGAPSVEFEATAGTDVAWRSLFSVVADLNVADAEFIELQSQVDLVNLADYYLLHFFSGDFDGSPSWYTGGAVRWSKSNNWYALRNRNRVGQAAKWQFFDHDSEHSLCADNGPRLRENIDNTTPWQLNAGDGSNFMGPAWLHAALVSNPAYRQIFVDRIQQHMLSPGGALTASENTARLNKRISELNGAIEAESARWGDGQAPVAAPTYGRAEWQNGIQRIRDCLAARPAIVEAQLRADNLWPSQDPPVITPAGGAVAYGTGVTVTTNQAGTLYYTTNGTDPRAPDGSVAASAQVAVAPVLVTNDLTVRARVLSGAQWSPLAEASFELSSPAGPVQVALNEFNAVSSTRFLGGGTAADAANGSDVTFGRVAGNGGDWFELVVIEDGADLRGWTIEVWNAETGVLNKDAALTFSNDPLFADLRAGTLITVSEDIPDDVSYDPIQDDWHINVQSNATGSGGFITAASQTGFAVNNDDTQIAILDAAGVPIQLRTGEGTVPDVSVSSTEVFKLEATPTVALTPTSSYADGATSTWGLPNQWSGGAETQDLTDLRILFGDVTCDGIVNLADALALAQFSVGGRDDAGSCPLNNLAFELYAEAGDVDGDGRTNLADALRVAQCAVGQINDFCPN